MATGFHPGKRMQRYMTPSSAKGIFLSYLLEMAEDEIADCKLHLVRSPSVRGPFLREDCQAQHENQEDIMRTETLAGRLRETSM